MKNSERPIGIFDSGLGGLTVFKAVRRLMPCENIIYFGDTARVPYGSKSKESVISFSKEITALLSARGVKLIIVACNTASSLALDEARKVSKVPVIGVIEPGARAAVAATANNSILVAGTTATVSSGAYRRTLKQIRPGVKVYEKACPLFVPLVEEGWCSKKLAEMVVSEYLTPLKKKGFDTVILGCTHYPLLKKVIARVLGGGVKIVDSAAVAASEAMNNLASRKLLNVSGSGRARFIASEAPEKFKTLALRLLGIKTGRVEVHRF